MAYDRDDRRYGRDQSYGYRPQGQSRDYERGYDRGEDLSYNRDRGYGGGDQGRGRVDYSRAEQSRGEYGRQGRVDYARSGYGGAGRSDQGRPSRDYDHDDRGFFERAGDEVRSWFGDEEAERRRRLDERYAQREHEQDRAYGRGAYGRETSGRSLASTAGYDAGLGLGLPAAGYGWNFRERDERDRHRDPSYRSWRDRQLESFDRDYDDYRREHQTKFDGEFAGYRTRRQGQRDSLNKVSEHQEVVGSDGAHVGKVDHVRNDRILLVKNDQNAGGHHHSIPSSWIETVDDKVTLNRTAAAAQQAWRDEEDERNRSSEGGSGNLNRSFPGTY